jgi:hypothetical protein
MRTLYTLLLSTTILTVSSFVFADDEAVTATIEIQGVRERLVPYKESYEMAKKVQAASEGRVALALRLIPTKPNVRIDDVQLSLEGETESVSINVLAGGIFVVPVNDEIAKQNGSYSVNKKKGELGARIILVPSVARKDWTIGLMRQVVSGAQTATSKITRWYERPFTTKITSVGVCSNQADVPLLVMNGKDVVAKFQLNEKATDDVDRPVFCKHFNGDDKLDDNLTVAIPEGAEVVLL